MVQSEAVPTEVGSQDPTTGPKSSHTGGLVKLSPDPEAPSLSPDLSFDFLQGMIRFSVLKPRG